MQKIPETIGVNYNLKILVIKYFDEDSDTLRYRKYHLEKEIERIEGLMDESELSDNDKLCDMLMETLVRKDDLIQEVDESFVLQLVRNLLERESNESPPEEKEVKKKKKKRKKKKKKLKGIKKLKKLERVDSPKETPPPEPKKPKEEFKADMSDVFDDEEKEYLQNEDLNLLSIDELDNVKGLMDSDFMMKQVAPGDEDYSYEKNVDFGEPVEDSGWD